MKNLSEKIAIQREARALAQTVAPGVPFVFIVDQMHQRVYDINGKPCLKASSWGSYAHYDYLAHPDCPKLRKLVKAGWRGLRGAM